MISVYKIKPAFQKLLLPLLKGLHKIGVTANQITIAAIALSALLGYFVMNSNERPVYLLLIAGGLLLRMALNALDGMMATRFNMKSKLGEVLNELGDIVSDSLIIFPLVAIPGSNPVILITFGVLAIINEYAGILAKAINGERRYDGPMGKSDRAFLIGLFCIISYFWKDVMLYTDWIFGVASFLVVISTIQRVRKSL